MTRSLAVVLALCLVGVALATPGCLNNQSSFNWNYIEFHDINLQPLDVVIEHSSVVLDYTTKQMMYQGDFIKGGTTFIGAVYVNDTDIYVVIHGTCYLASTNTTGIFDQQCVQNTTEARPTTIGTNNVLVFREDLSYPSLNVVRRTYTYWTSSGVIQPLAWQSMFLNPQGQEVGTSSWVADGYVPTADPAKLAVPAICQGSRLAARYANFGEAARANPLLQVAEIVVNQMTNL